MKRVDQSPLAMVLVVLLALGVAVAQDGQGVQSAISEQQMQISIDAEVAQPGGDLPGDPQIELELVAEGLVDPVNVASAGDGRVFIVERVGRILVVDEDGNLLDEPFLDIQGSVEIGFLEQGLLGLAFHPDFAENGRFYVNYSDYQTNGAQWIVEYQVSGDDQNVADPGTGRVLLTIPEPYVNHNGGTIKFGPDGYLYIAVGDGGYAGDPWDNARDPSTLLGSILRIDPNVDDESVRYRIPEDNPLAPSGEDLRANIESAPHHRPDARPEVWAYGLRNPWQFAFDNETGDIYIADVGQNRWEEVNVVPSGGIDEAYNFGWDYMEASHCYPSETDDDETNDVDCLVGILPVAEYNHEQGDCSITGLGVYRGDEFADMAGIYFASDFCSGRVWGLAQDDGGDWQFEELLDTDLPVTGAGTGADGDVYLTSCNCQFGRGYDPFENPGGQVWRVVQAGSGEGTTIGADGQQVSGGQMGGDEQQDDQQDGADQQGDREGEGTAAPDGAEEGQPDQQNQPDQEDQPEQQEQTDQQQQPDQEQQPEQQPEQEDQEQQDTDNQGQAETSQGQEGNLQALAAQGDEIFHSSANPPCSTCHGQEGQGGIGPALAGNEDLEDAAFVINRILRGVGQMPPYGGQLSDEQVAAVATFIRNSWENDFGVVTASAVEAER